MTGIIKEMHRVIVEVIGDDQQASAIVYALVGIFGGERLYIPGHNYAQRNQEITDLYTAGATIKHLSNRYSLAESTIRRIIQHQAD